MPSWIPTKYLYSMAFYPYNRYQQSENFECRFFIDGKVQNSESRFFYVLKTYVIIDSY